MYQYDIMGLTWTIWLDEDLGGDLGLTSSDKRTIKIAPHEDNEVLLSTIVHEICHAHFSSACLDSADIHQEAFEEIACDIFSYHGKRILHIANDILQQELAYKRYLKGEV